MHFIIAITSISPLRAEASHRAEMVSQMLFGETAEVIDVSEDFFKVRTTLDNYTGWIQQSQTLDITKKFFRKKVKGLVTENKIIFLNKEPILLPMGAPVWHTNNIEYKTVKYGRVPLNTRLEFTKENMVLIARKFLNSSYLWGGRTVFGTDCSGFTQQVFRILHVPLPRDAYKQSEVGELVGFLPEVECGDLAFFDNAEGRITHVGILLSDKRIIHAAGNVRIDKIDTQGIVNIETGLRTHNLRMIKRIKKIDK